MSNMKTSEIKPYSSDIRINMNREFVYQNFPAIRRENDPVYGVSGSDEVALEPVNFDTLNYLLMRPGTYMVLFGGVWSQNTQSVIGRVNSLARRHGVDTVYFFDFSADGTEEGNIKQDITAHEYYTGPDKKEVNPFAVYNYLYGEVVTRYLTNLNGWVEKKVGSGDDITYLNLYRDPVTVPNLTEPFLFIYNKDNTVDHSGCGVKADTYPIVWAAELGEADDHTEQELEEKIFAHVGEGDCVITPYTPGDYMREAYAINGRGHAFKTEDAFKEGEQINLHAICFQVYHWLLQQEGTFMILLAGPWCANSQAAIATVNDYAVANHVRVYVTDSRLDSKHAIDFWKYPRKNELTMSCPPMRKYYMEIWRKYLPGATVMCSMNGRPGRIRKPILEYINENGETETALSVGIPYCYAYNKDHEGGHGHKNPILASFHNETMELINTSEKFAYYAPTYQEFKASVYKVIYAYMEDLGLKAEEITIDRTAPIVEGKPVKHVETVAYYKEYDWYQEPEDPKAINLTKNPAGAKTFSSDIDIDMTKEFVYWNYPLMRRENDPVHGVVSAKEVVFQPVDIDTLCYVLMSKGTHMVLFGGVWSENTQSVIGRINALALKHGVDTVFLYDFSADGTEFANIKRDLTEQETYDGPDKKESNPFAIYNYIYGEIVTRHLKNLNDWAAKKADTKDDITYLNLYQDAVSVPNLTEPFLFIFNKDNTVDHSGCGVEADTYPIVWAAELGRADENTDSELEEKIFSHVGEEGCEITPYTMEDYFREAFAKNERGHSFKTEDAFKPDEKINLCKVSFQVFHWLLQQRGSFILQLAGPWCAYSQGSAATMNDFAVTNGARVYMTDIRLDSKHAIDFWKYPRKNELTLSCPPMRKYDIEIWEKYFPGALIATSLNPNMPANRQRVTVDYVDEEGNEHSVLSVGVPYMLSYNKDHLNADGRPSPLLATRHDAGELINCSQEFVYHEPIYKEFRASLFKIYEAYEKSLGREAKEPEIDRTAPIVPGEPVRHIETVAYTKEHDWYKERADRV